MSKETEVKDFKYKSELADNLVAEKSLLNDFSFTEAMAFDQSFEGVGAGNVLFGGMQIKKKKYADDTAGIWFGMDSDRNAKMYLGDSSKSVKWDGTNLYIKGDLTAGSININNKAIIDSSGNASFVGLTALNMNTSTCFENSARFDVTGVSNSGTIVFDASGMRLNTGATAGSLALTKWFVCQEALKSSPVFSVVIEVANASSNGLQAVFSIGEPALTGSSFNPVGHHCGFYLYKTGGGAINLYALQSNNSGETKSGSLTTIANGDVMDLIVKMNGTTSVDYYWRKNGGSLSAKTTLSTKVPDIKRKKTTFGLSNFNQNGQNQIIVISSSYSR